MKLLPIKNLFAGLVIDVPGTNKDPDSIIEDAFKIVIALVGVAVIGYFIYGGVLIATAAGDQNKFKQGMDTLMNAVIGLVIAMVAVLVINLIAKVLGVDLWRSISQFS